MTHVRVETEDSASGPVDPERVAGKPTRPPLDARPRQRARLVAGHRRRARPHARRLRAHVADGAVLRLPRRHAVLRFRRPARRVDRRLRQRPRRGAGDAARRRRADRRLRDRRRRRSCAAGGRCTRRRASSAGSVSSSPCRSSPRRSTSPRTWRRGSPSATTTAASRIPTTSPRPTVVSTLAWLKMLAYGAGLLCVAAVCLLAFARRKESATPIPRAGPADRHEHARPTRRPRRVLLRRRHPRRRLRPRGARPTGAAPA